MSFVIAVIIAPLRIPPIYHIGDYSGGILGAIVFRAFNDRVRRCLITEI